MEPEAEAAYSRLVSFLPESVDEDRDTERDALMKIDPVGFFIRHPPKPHMLDAELTNNLQLFQTIHMGAAVVDEHKWKLVFDGLVERPFSISLAQLRSMPRASVTAFHECYGSPLLPPVHAVWRIGNVKWTGVRLADVLRLARPLPKARFVWSRGLDWGSFGGTTASCYEKDLPFEKAMASEVLIAYEMNGERLDKKRGAPVRLIVPGYFGTNSTKWLCRLSLQEGRATGPFTTTFYNEVDPTDPEKQRMRPVWKVEPNSIIVSPKPDASLDKSEVEIWGRAWSCESIEKVVISIDGGESWLPPQIVELSPRLEFEWQLFRAKVSFSKPGKYKLVARATDQAGASQPLAGRRNHVHSVEIEIV
jgi:DMSO/TMAO reductase YedYZ molybdopterin-dependent catalytic subunit